MAHRFLKLSLVCMAIIASTDLKPSKRRSYGTTARLNIGKKLSL